MGFAFCPSNLILEEIRAVAQESHAQIVILRKHWLWVFLREPSSSLISRVARLSTLAIFRAGMTRSLERAIPSDTMRILSQEAAHLIARSVLLWGVTPPLPMRSCMLLNHLSDSRRKPVRQRSDRMG